MEPQRDPYLWKQAKARVGFRMHLRSYLVVNAGLWLIWALTSFAIRDEYSSRFLFPWPLFAMLGWGIGLVSHYFSVYRTGNQKDMIEEEYKKLAGRQ
ncbi:2TM domain-containing protein [Spirosoma soli]|uniref:2TM domain-containing protein n=1 Tax=Spirosoma soli TaxID=1770529 RepID=A0ABW5LY70_9BACT